MTQVVTCHSRPPRPKVSSCAASVSPLDMITNHRLHEETFCRASTQAAYISETMHKSAIAPQHLLPSIRRLCHQLAALSCSQPRHKLQVARGRWADLSMTNEEVDDDQAAVGLELSSGGHNFRHTAHRPQLKALHLCRAVCKSVEKCMSVCKYTLLGMHVRACAWSWSVGVCV